MRRRRSYGQRPIVNSITNRVDSTASIGTTIQKTIIAKGKNTPLSTVANDVSNGCIIQAIWVSFDICGLAATGVLQRTGLYLFKNPGDNLTPPAVFSIGTSNEKRFVIRSWQYMTMRNQDGNAPIHWEGWIPIPKKYQRTATDDTWNLQFACDAAAGHYSSQFIYKWKR